MTPILGILEYLPTILLGLAASILALNHVDGWGWFLFLAVFEPHINLRDRVITTTTNICPECEEETEMEGIEHL